MKRYYKRRRYRSNIFRLSRNERNAYRFIRDIITMIIFVVTGIVKETYKLSKYINKIIVNHKALKQLGYELDDILDLVYKISPRQFEIFCAELFKQRGYEVKLTPPTADYGRDIILNGNIFVECKHYTGSSMIGREICQKLLGSCQMMNAKRGIIITCGSYHRNAYECAGRVDNLQLMDITDIQKMILDLDAARISKVVMKTLNAS